MEALMELQRPRNPRPRANFTPSVSDTSDRELIDSDSLKAPDSIDKVDEASANLLAKLLINDSTERRADPSMSGMSSGAVRDREIKSRITQNWAKNLKRRSLKSESVELEQMNHQRPGDTEFAASKLIKQYSSTLGLDEKGLGQALAGLALSNPGENKALIAETLRQLKVKPGLIGGDNKGQVALHMIKSLSNSQLNDINGSRDGVDVLRFVRRAIKSTGITLEEAKELSRLEGSEYRTPTPSQVQEIQNLINAGDREKAIQKTIEYYKIDVSMTTEIAINLDLPADKPGRINQVAMVEIGPSAFETPAMLAATLAHECEIHAKQISEDRWYDSEQGIALNEVEGYDHVISNASRFGLSDMELRQVVSKRREYYRAMTPATKYRADNEDYKIWVRLLFRGSHLTSRRRLAAGVDGLATWARCWVSA
jgi:hypothetical protein